MNDGEKQEPRFLLTIFAALWVMAYVYSFVAFATTAAGDIGFTRGMNRITAFLGWQGVAGILAICLFGVSRYWPKGSSVRRNARVPLVLAGLLILGILGVIFWARLGQ